VDFAGKQYNMTDFANICEPLLAEPNCYHRARAIILGVSPSVYTQKQLDELNAEDARKREFEGKEYTKYEALQVQRRLETAIRKEKDQAIALQAAGDTDAARLAKAKVTALSEKYVKFSNATEVKTEWERAAVAGYTRGASKKTIEKLKQEAYNKSVADAKRVIAELPKGIRNGQQNKHIAGTKEYNDYTARLTAKGEYGPSRINGGIADAQRLVDEYSGKGEPVVVGGKWLNSETILSNSDTMGIVVNNRNGDEAETTIFKIHYSKKGVHVVPDYPSKGR
jgi:hypothetical protein